LEDACGFFVREYCAAVVIGDPDAPEFKECCAHEICHALLYAFTGASGRFPWASEGYAVLVSYRVVEGIHFPGRLRDHAVAAGIGSSKGKYRHLPDLILASTYAEVCDEHIQAFYSKATLFMHYLFLQATKRPAIGSLITQIVSERIACPGEVVARLQHALGASIHEIGEDFHEWCGDVARCSACALPSE
jgi:hypothetical protein